MTSNNISIVTPERVVSELDRSQKNSNKLKYSSSSEVFSEFKDSDSGDQKNLCPRKFIIIPSTSASAIDNHSLLDVSQNKQSKQNIPNNKSDVSLNLAFSRANQNPHQLKADKNICSSMKLLDSGEFILFFYNFLIICLVTLKLY